MTLFLTNSRQPRMRLVQAGVVFAAIALVPGCGSVYRSVVTPIGNSGPASQPTAYAVVVSAPSPTTPGIATIVDYSGDSVLAYASIGPGPSLMAVSENGTQGYTVNSDGTLSYFPVSPSLQTKQVTFTTLNASTQPGPPHPPVNMFSLPIGLWTSDIVGSYADIFTSSTGVQAFDLAIPVAPTPVLIAGPPLTGERNYSISLNATTASSIIPFDVTCNNPSNFPTLITNGQNGEADGIEIASLTISSRIPVGVCPVYAVQTTDNRRFFVLNRGSDTITVINSVDNTLDDQCPTGCVNQDGQTYYTHPTLPLSATAITNTGIVPTNCINNKSTDPTCSLPADGGLPATAGPVYAEYNAATSQLVVADYDGGTISIIDVSEDNFGNDSPTFGTTYTVPVGNTSPPYPASVTVLVDGSRAYTANQGDGAVNGTVTIVNLSSHTVEKTLPVIGHPRTVASIQNSQYGKIYVASPDSPYLTILRTDLDIVDTTILVEGNIVDVRVTSPNASSGNSNVTSRNPGAGQPCNLPPSLLPSGYTLAQCQAQP
jgi:hypothetical protein